jgi:Domain of unknown function (DUF4375)
LNLLAKGNYRDLDEVQRVAHLCFWYDSEVQNGGHLQYFENRGTSLLNETLAALHLLGAESQRSILEAAGHAFTSGTRKEQIDTVEEYVTAARSAEFAVSDSAYYACSPPIPELLADYLERNMSHFIEITDNEKGG